MHAIVSAKICDGGSLAHAIISAKTMTEGPLQVPLFQQKPMTKGLLCKPLFQQKSMTEGLLCMPLFQQKSTKTSLCLVDMEKLNINAVRQSDGDLKVNFSLQSLTVDDTRLDSTLAIRRYSEACLQNTVRNEGVKIVTRGLCW